MFNRNLLKNFDYVLLVVVLIIVGIGIVMISSATGHKFSSYAEKQLIAAILGFFALIFMASIDYSKLTNLMKPLYGFGILLLLAVLAIGHVAKGAKSWINLGGGFALQPSEIMKVIIILTLAYYLSKKEDLKSWKDLIFPLAHVGFPIILILLQPDLGSTLVFIGILFGVLFVAGINYKHLFSLMGAGIAAMPLFWHFLKDYQKKRILTFIDPSLDPTGSGYNIIQSKIAIGSGGILGKGLYHGSQTSLNFLPEPHTDFIFSVIGEELGFIGAGIILFLYFLLVWRGIKIAMEAKDRFGMLLASGVVCLYTLHILVNIGGATGIMPLTGLPLPLMSYGGSSLLTNMAALGILESVHIRRKELMF